ncbi:MAG: patatin family protein [Oscillospiraceae bacterium]|jgi:predicted patatin/cPLA2 family phospholipase|nr:patatin family protein [Oscillospiraceae bacterium]
MSIQPIIIPSVPPETVIPDAALVLEGGGTRAYFSSGVMDAFIAAGVMFPYIIGVSAGAANAITYVSGQYGRSRVVVENFVSSPRYVGVRNLFLHGSLFNYKFVFDEIAAKHLPLDWKAFRACPARFLAGAIDIDTGETVYYSQDDYETGDFTPLIASCSVPLLSRVVKYRGRRLLDGGVGGGIPIERSVADGNAFHVIVMTRTAGYVKRPEPFGRAWRLMYRRYPKLTDALAHRHENYARQVGICETLEREGKAMIIRPVAPLWEGRAESDTSKLLALYDEGERLGRDALPRLLSR